MGFVEADVARRLEVELAQALAVLQAHGVEPPPSVVSPQLTRSAAQRRPGSSAFQPTALSPAATASAPSGPSEAAPLKPAEASAEMGEARSYADGEALYRQGELAENVFIVLQGQVKLSDADDGTPERALGPGQLLGEQAMFEEGVHSESLRALGTAHCLLLPTQRLRSLIPADGSLLSALMMALVLQHRMVVRLAASQGPADHALFDQRTFTAPELHRALVEARNRAPGEGLSSSQCVCLQLQTSEAMPMRLLRAGTTLGQPGLEHIGLGVMMVHGLAQARIGGHEVSLGQGSVVGVAEGLCAREFGWTFTAAQDLNVRAFPIDRALQRLRRADPLVQALAAHLCERILALQAGPASG